MIFRSSNVVRENMLMSGGSGSRTTRVEGEKRESGCNVVVVVMIVGLGRRRHRKLKRRLRFMKPVRLVVGEQKAAGVKFRHGRRHGPELGLGGKWRRRRWWWE